MLVKSLGAQLVGNLKTGKLQYSSALQGVGVREWEGVGVEGWVEPQGAERLLRTGSHLMSLYQGTLSLHP